MCQKKDKVPASGFLKESHLSLSALKWPSSSNTPPLLGNLFKALRCVPYRGQSLSLVFPSYRQQIPEESRLSMEWIFLQSTGDLGLF